MLNYGFDNYKYYEIIEEGDIVGEINVSRTRSVGGMDEESGKFLNFSKTAKVPICYDQGLMLPLNKSEVESIKLVPKFEKEFVAPVKAGDIVGAVDIIAEGEVLRTVGLETTASAERHDFESKVWEIIDSWVGVGSVIILK